MTEISKSRESAFLEIPGLPRPPRAIARGISCAISQNFAGFREWTSAIHQDWPRESLISLKNDRNVFDIPAIWFDGRIDKITPLIARLSERANESRAVRHVLHSECTQCTSFFINRHVPSPFLRARRAAYQPRPFFRPRLRLFFLPLFYFASRRYSPLPLLLSLSLSLGSKIHASRA